MRRWALGLLLLVGCPSTGSPGAAGPVGPAGAVGPTGPAGTAAETGVSCAPGARFCQGDTLWSCTLSGRDAYGAVDCAGLGSAANPGLCSTSCPQGSAACCARSAPLCSFSFQTPAVAGQDLGCIPPSAIAPSCSGSGAFELQLDLGAPGSCSLDRLRLSIDRSKHHYTETLILPEDGASLTLETGSGPPLDCTGTVSWRSDVPSWGLQVRVTCGTATVDGSASGAL